MKNFLRRKLFSLLAPEFRRISNEQRIMERKLEFLMRTCKRVQRRKWDRLLRKEMSTGRGN